MPDMPSIIDLRPRRAASLARGALACATLLVAACEKAADTTPVKPEPTTAAPVAKKAVDPATVGSIRGVVRFEGKAPKRTPMDIAGSGGCPAHDGTPQLTEDVIVNDGKLANVFVQLRGADGWIAPAPAPRTVVLDQTGCMYRPRVLGMRVGDALRVKNSGPTTHNVNIRASRNDGANPQQPPNGADIEWKPTKREVMVPLECTLHPWMKAWVGVLDHPWFAVSGAEGAFSIEGVPPGEYELEGWHEKLGKCTAKIVVPAHDTASIEIVYRAP
jgi:hypothetical protein